jgi:hypothetical protein
MPLSSRSREKARRVIPRDVEVDLMNKRLQQELAEQHGGPARHHQTDAST